ncbi:TRADD-N-associated membrane domain-containing protein [Spirillospora sp. CA-128828]|uniref:TRADD-N-associated membrane domain-containing protein n=1 Tax=Spirillospora sp. CA-128828 TaxID=3240033 RepID=UPI003D948596
MDLSSSGQWVGVLGAALGGAATGVTFIATLVSSKLSRRAQREETKAREALDRAEQAWHLSLAHEKPTEAANLKVESVNTGDIVMEGRVPLEKVREGTQVNLALPALWDVTHKRLDYYHKIATTHARQSFRNSQIAMGIGFALLIGFAALALNAETTTASIVSGGLGAAAAGFAGYISRTFVRSQESAASHLRAYFNQPLEFSRYLAAERLLESLNGVSDELRGKIVGDLIQGFVGQVGPPEVQSSAADSNVDGKSNSAGA